MSSFSVWLQGIIHAALSGAANGLGGVVIDPAKFNIQTRGGWKAIGLIAAWGAFIGVVSYLRTSPLDNKAQPAAPNPFAPKG